MVIDTQPTDVKIVYTFWSFVFTFGASFFGVLLSTAASYGVFCWRRLNKRKEIHSRLMKETERNIDILEKDLKIEHNLEWFRRAMEECRRASPTDGKIEIELDQCVCWPEYVGYSSTHSVGDSRTHYYAPTNAIWVMAIQTGMGRELPDEAFQAHSRIEHNFNLLRESRKRVIVSGERLVSLHLRCAKWVPGKERLVWQLNESQIAEFETCISDAYIALWGLVFRLKWALAKLREFKGLLEIPASKAESAEAAAVDYLKKYPSLL